MDGKQSKWSDSKLKQFVREISHRRAGLDLRKMLPSKLLLCTRLLWRKIVMVVAPVLLLPFLVSDSKVSKCAYVAVLMAVYWATEAIPLAVTALMPVVLLPLLEILSTEATSNFYIQETNMMFIGTLIMAIAIEHSNLHRRIALKVLCTLGTEIKRLLFGVIIISMFLAIWINNIATTAMMMPILDAVTSELLQQKKSPKEVYINGGFTPEGTGQETEINGNIRTVSEEIKLPNSAVIDREAAFPVDELVDEEELKAANKYKAKLRVLLYLTVTYGANVGAIATITSAASNVVFKFVIEEQYQGRAPVDYTTWLLYSLPPAVASVILVYLGIWAMYLRNPPPSSQINESSAKNIIKKKYDELGPMRFHELAVLLLFILLVLLWMFRDPFFTSGWATYFPSMKPKDATASVFTVLLLFMVPSKPMDILHCPPLITWNVVQEKLQWSVILLLGGGFALAEGAKVSGLSSWIGEQMTLLGNLPQGLLMLLLCIITAFITEILSNAGTVTILLPVFAKLAEELHINPLLLMIPATLTSNYAFLLPVGTPANTIAYEHAKLKTSEMILPGLMVKTVTVLTTCAFVFILGNPIFDMFSFPDWVKVQNATRSGITSTIT